jgi:selenocysteine lyase/cysteine desulfurase
VIFLDSAATTLQKPLTVSRAMAEAVNTAASPGRGGYPAAERGAELVYRCRTAAAECFGVSEPERVVLTSSATHSLNIALRSLAGQRRGRVVLSGYEHNAVTRTLTALGVEQDVVRGGLFRPEELLEGFAARLRGAAFAVCTQVSNVFGYVLPLEEIGALCRQYSVPLVVDASQGAGCLPLSVEALGAEYVAMPGHKGLYGPQGTGLLLCGPEAVPEPLLFGGTGSESLVQTMPDFLPDRLEPGTHNVCGAAGLLMGMNFVREKGPEVILAHERRLRREMARRLQGVPGLRVLESEEPELQTGVLSVVSEKVDCEELGNRLGSLGVCTRAGLHCAPLAHESAGTLETGTLRLSFSAFNLLSELPRVERAFRQALRRAVG